jgi:hypothetical protein
MYDLIKIVAEDGVTQITINELTEPCYYPVEVFTWTPSFVGEQRPRLKGPGRHGSFRDIETQEIQLEGHIKTDTTDDYWAKRKALLNVAVPDPLQIVPWHGYLMFQVNGDTETYYQKVQLEHCEIPTEALYPTVTPMRFEWSGLEGYWLKLSNDQPAKI